MAAPCWATQDAVRRPAEATVASQLGVMGSDLQGAYTSLYYMSTEVAGNPFPGLVSRFLSVPHRYVKQSCGEYSHAEAIRELEDRFTGLSLVGIGRHWSDEATVID